MPIPIESAEERELNELYDRIIQAIDQRSDSLALARKLAPVLEDQLRRQRRQDWKPRIAPAPWPLSTANLPTAG